MAKSELKGKRPITIIITTTVPITLLSFYVGQIKYLKDCGYEVMAISSPGEDLFRFSRRESVRVYCVKMTRGISPFADLIALVKLYLLFRKLSPTIVHGSTPKGGLLAMLASYFAKVPIRFYTVRGLHITSKKGLLGAILAITERISCACADKVFAVSRAMREVLIEKKICPEGKIVVLHKGSSNGVDTVKFRKTVVLPVGSGKMILKARLPKRALVIGYVGRIVNDKGVVELLKAWSILKYEYPNVCLLVVGSFEPHDPTAKNIRCQILNDSRVYYAGMLTNVVDAYRAMNMVVLPSYREGFPNVPLEAAAMELPVIATKVPGCEEAVMDGDTGILVPPKDIIKLYNAIKILLENPDIREKMGDRGRKRVVLDFEPVKIWEGLHNEYTAMIRKKLHTEI